MKYYFKSNAQSYNAVRIELRYLIGGKNKTTNVYEKRGYYLFVVPIVINEKFGIFNETPVPYEQKRLLLFHVDRKTQSNDKKVEQLFIENIAYYIKQINEKYGFICSMEYFKK